MCAHCVAEKFISGLPLGAHCGVCAKDLLGWTVRATRATRAAPARRVDLPLPASCVRPPGLSTPTRELSQWRISLIWFAMMALEHPRWAGILRSSCQFEQRGFSKTPKRVKPWRKFNVQGVKRHQKEQLFVFNDTTEGHRARNPIANDRQP
jgi:hypothetical protein